MTASGGDRTGLWVQVGALLRSHRAVVDLPVGSTHPEHDWMVYPLDYGYLEGTSAVDGDGVDVFLGKPYEESELLGHIAKLSRRVLVG